MTELVRVDPAHPDASDIGRAADCLRRGGLVAFPTETVYGLGAHALDPDAVRRIFTAKGRPATDPLIVHVANLAQATALAAVVPDAAHLLAARFWPGPLTLVLRKIPSVPTEVTAGLDTVALRVPAHPVARSLLLAANLPVAAPSANRFSRPSPTRASHVLDDLDGRIDMVLDGGPTDAGIESTVVDLTTEQPILLRPGVVTLEALREILPALRLREPLAVSEQAPQSSPGLLSKHYAPRTPVTLFDGDAAAVASAIRAAAVDAQTAGRHVGALVFTEDATALAGLSMTVTDLGSRRDAEAVARRLYSALRELDAFGLDGILAAGTAGDEGLGRAIRDRLRRAATHVITVSAPAER